MEGLQRIVKKGKAKDYQRNAKYFDYYYIIYKNKSYTLNLNGWTYQENIKVLSNKCFIDGQCIQLIFN